MVFFMLCHQMSLWLMPSVTREKSYVITLMGSSQLSIVVELMVKLKTWSKCANGAKIITRNCQHDYSMICNLKGTAKNFKTDLAPGREEKSNATANA